MAQTMQNAVIINDEKTTDIFVHSTKINGVILPENGRVCHLKQVQKEVSKTRNT